jgi:hypothetical protein
MLPLIVGAASLASTLAGMYQSQQPTAQSKMSKSRWTGLAPDATKMLSGLFYNPAMGNQPRYKNTKGNPNLGGYAFAPSKSMQDIYSSYLNRSYGLSNQVANSMVSQAVAPIKIGELKRGMSASAMNRSTQTDPNSLASAMLNIQTPGGVEQMDYLKNAGSLASYNAWRAKQLGELIG